MATLWVVTREINAYDQEGEYFVAAWLKKPTFDQLKQAVDRPDQVINHLLETGGGRIKIEDEWYNLREIEEGELI